MSKRWVTVSVANVPEGAVVGSTVEYLLKEGVADRTVALVDRRIVVDIGRTRTQVFKYGRRIRLQVYEEK